jgi:hypothetical protein
MKRYQVTYGKGHREIWGQYSKLSDALTWFEILIQSKAYPFPMLLDRGKKENVRN